MTGAAALPAKQHLISKVLLRRFSALGASEKLRSFDLLYGQSKLRHRSEVAWRLNFVEHEPAEFEKLWQQTERDLAVALDTVELGTAFDTPAIAATLRQTIALHYMRRDAVKDSFGKSFARAHKAVAAPADFPGDPHEFRSAVRAGLDAARAETFATNLRSLFERAQLRVASDHLEVFHSEAPLLIGDSAVLSVSKDGGAGVIPFTDASTHVLPVGRHHLIALAPEDKTAELPEQWAHSLNEQQILHSRRHVFFHPDDNLEPFVHEVRDRHRGRSSAPAAR